MAANFYKDNLIVEDAYERYKKMLAIANRRKTICILMQEPDKERVFASVIGPAQKQFTGPEQRRIEFPYVENNYQEDIRDREELS